LEQESVNDGHFTVFFIAQFAKAQQTPFTADRCSNGPGIKRLRQFIAHYVRYVGYAD
jgi:hypothetical protein